VGKVGVGEGFSTKDLERCCLKSVLEFRKSVYRG
jgi:hypothetical protein